MLSILCRELTVDESIRRVRDFIGADPLRGTNAFLTTFTSAGDPYLRQVSTFVEGWIAGTISNVDNLKVRHLRRDPRAVWLWAEEQPANRRRNVWIRGRVEIVEDPAVIQAFLERRAAVTGWPAGEACFQRVLLRLMPEFLRGEGFDSAEFTSRQSPVILREFPEPPPPAFAPMSESAGNQLTRRNA